MSAIVTLSHGAESSALAAPALVDHAAKSQADLGLQRGHDGVVGVGGIAPDAIGAGGQVFGPAVQAGPVAIAPDGIGSASVVYAPFVGDGTGQGIGPDAIASAAQVFAVLMTAVAAGRIQRISAEDRVLVVAVEGRMLAVNFESRTSAVQGE